jgi:hypothetical protein
MPVIRSKCTIAGKVRIAEGVTVPMAVKLIYSPDVEENATLHLRST